MFALATQLSDAFERLVWDSDSRGWSWWRKALLRTVRIAYAVIRELAEGQLTLRAMSLVYTTLLSLVPLLAVSVSLLKGFGVHYQKIEPLLANLLAPMGEKGAEVTARVIEFVENISAGILGAAGLAVLLFTVVSLILKIEGAFNYTWRVPDNRPLAQRFSSYLSVILIGPVMVVAALSITATVTNAASFAWLVETLWLGPVVESLARLLPYLLIIGAFTFIYVFVPNTRVRVGSALVGAMVAGVLWESSGWAFTSFVSSTNYTAIYSAFATLFLFMIWLFLCWLILLTGASIAFYHQNPAYLVRGGRQPTLSLEQRERLTLAMLYFVARRFRRDDGLPWTHAELATALTLPQDLVASLLQPLIEQRILVRVERGGYLPALALEKISITSVLTTVRSAGASARPAAVERDLTPVDALLDRLCMAVDDALAGMTLADLVADEPGGATTLTAHRERITG